MKICYNIDNPTNSSICCLSVCRDAGYHVPLAQALVDMIAEGKAESPVGIYSTAPLTGDDITSECKADIALEKGHIYDLHDLGMYLALMIQNGTEAHPITTMTAGTPDSTVCLMKDGERLNGCVEINEAGALCYYEVTDGEARYVEAAPQPGMYRYIEKSGSGKDA